VLIKLVITKTTRHEGSDTETEYEQSLFVKLSGAYVLNSACIPVMLGIALSLRVSDTPINQAWYEDKGVVGQAFSLLMITASLDFVKAAPPEVFLNRFVKARWVYTQAKLNALYRGPPMYLSQLYAETVKKVALGLIYGPLFPPAYLITSLALFNSYVCTRAGMRYWYRRPAGVDYEMMMTMRRTFGLVLLLATLVQIFAAQAATREGSGALVISIGTPVLWLLYEVAPLHMVPGFETHKDDEIVNESEGVMWKDVPRKRGYEMLRYHCPRVTDVGEHIHEDDPDDLASCITPRAVAPSGDTVDAADVAYSLDVYTPRALAAGADSSASPRSSAARTSRGALKTPQWAQPACMTPRSQAV